MKILNKKKFKIPLVIASFTTIANYTSEDFNKYYDANRRAQISLLANLKCFIYYRLRGKVVDEDFHNYCSNIQFESFKKSAGTYIKLGQYISQQEHQINKIWVKSMEPLCQVNTETPYEEVKKIVEKEFGKNLEDIFSEFSERPVSSASIGQVHKAKLKSNNKTVAVKVQHPKIAFQSTGDILVGRFSMRICEYIYPDFKFLWMYDELEKNMKKELDFKTEADNCRKIRKLFKKDDSVIVPEIIDEFSGNKVITMTWEEGKSITDREYRIKNNIKTKEIAELLANSFNKQIFEFGFVHGDPHSGNLFMRKENNKTKLVLLDHGLYETLDEKFKYSYATLWRGTIFNLIIIINC
jgi:aarF domain-containing kinase